MHSVASVAPDDTVALGLDDFLNLVTNLTVRYAGLADGDTGFHGRLGGRDQIKRRLGAFANWICGVKIRVEAAVV